MPVHLLAPVAASGLAEAVGQQLADAIQLGLLVEGEQLPAEATLAAQLGVSTVTLRDALAALRRQGLVETRRGRHGGSFVVGPTAAPTTRMRTRLLELSVVELRDLGDEWTAVAGTAARLAAARASDAEVGRLRGFADTLAGAATVGERVRANSRFGIELALASQSERLTREPRSGSRPRSASCCGCRCDGPLDQAVVAADLHEIAPAVAPRTPPAPASSPSNAPSATSAGWSRPTCRRATSDDHRVPRPRRPLSAARRLAQASVLDGSVGTDGRECGGGCGGGDRGGDRRGVRRAAGDGGSARAGVGRAGAARSWVRPLGADAILALQPQIFEQLDAQPAFDSAGYVMAEAALADSRRHLEWWHRGNGATFQPLILTSSPEAADCYDYYTMDWFFAALTERRRFASGPHIDLPCADVCIMTFTEPVLGAGPARTAAARCGRCRRGAVTVRGPDPAAAAAHRRARRGRQQPATRHHVERRDLDHRREAGGPAGAARRRLAGGPPDHRRPRLDPRRRPLTHLPHPRSQPHPRPGGRPGSTFEPRRSCRPRMRGTGYR